MIAYSLLPDRFEDGRHVALENGLRAVGYEVRKGLGRPRSQDDVLICWNLHGKAEAARRFEREGGRLVVAEEAYFRVVNGEKCFALALGGHNGSGRWNVGGPERWASFGIELSPWRRDGGHVLVCGQRGIGAPEMQSPPDWHWKAAERLGKLTRRPVVVRRHPKERDAPAQPSLEEQLRGCWAVVVWASAVAAQALACGVPVFYQAPHHVLAPALNRDLARIDAPILHDRRPAFERMAWAQWRRSEIESGEAFRRLLA